MTSFLILLFGTLINLTSCGIIYPVDTTPPTVISVFPANGSTDAWIDTNISFTFSEAIDPSTITASGSFSLVSSEGPITGSITYDAISKTATFTPNHLGFWTTYTATISADVKDIAGNAMANKFTWSFSTSGPPLSPHPL